MSQAPTDLSSAESSDCGAPAIKPHSRDDFSLAEARSIIKDLFEPNPTTYWIDFLASLICGHILYLTVAFAPELFGAGSPWIWPVRIIAFFPCCLLYYRCVLFTHELVHIRPDKMRLFRIVWNFFCGCAFLAPSFLYYTHVDHHRRKHFGTKEDGEYIPLGTMPRFWVLLYLAQCFVIPLLGVFRFGLLTPLTWIHPVIRDLIHQNASSLIMDPMYIRPLPTKSALKIIRLQEMVCFVWILVAAALLSTVLRPWAATLLLETYLIGFVVITVNAVRTLGSHLWTNKEGEMTFLEQYLDSVNYPHRWWITELWGPVGLRFHALHHLFPSLPYHSMAEADRRLRERLPTDSLYHRAERVSLLEVVGELMSGKERKLPTV